MSNVLRVIIADDERPARSFLARLLEACEDVTLIGAAQDGTEAVALIEAHRPDLVLLDWQMPEVDGPGVVRLLDRDKLPLVAFVTAYDEYAVKAFEVNAIDYLLKPVTPVRLRATLNRAHERLARPESRPQLAAQLDAALSNYENAARPAYLERLPVRLRDDIILLPVNDLVSVAADGEWLHLTTRQGAKYMLNHRLKDLAARLAPTEFLRLSRSAVVRLDYIRKISPLPGGTYLVTLQDGQQIAASRANSRFLREQLLRL